MGRSTTEASCRPGRRAERRTLWLEFRDSMDLFGSIIVARVSGQQALRSSTWHECVATMPCRARSLLNPNSRETCLVIGADEAGVGSSSAPAGILQCEQIPAVDVRSIAFKHYFYVLSFFWLMMRLQADHQRSQLLVMVEVGTARVEANARPGVC